MSTKFLSAERREYLQRYILTCIRDSALTWEDLKSPRFLDKMMQILSRDVKVVLNELGKQGAAGLLQVGSLMLSRIAESVMKRKT